MRGCRERGETHPQSLFCGRQTADHAIAVGHWLLVELLSLLLGFGVLDVLMVRLRQEHLRRSGL
jgi:hypothetical protein